MRQLFGAKRLLSISLSGRKAMAVMKRINGAARKAMFRPKAMGCGFLHRHATFRHCNRSGATIAPFCCHPAQRAQLPPPPAFSSKVDSQFYQAALEVYTTVKALTPEQKLIARYWADDPWLTITPPGHSLAIATQVLEQEEASLEMAAITYAKLGIAVADSFIACWRDKYTWNLIRPLTYIQRNIDATWNKPSITDPVITPPFPSYPSGHASDSAAAMAVLTDLVGANYHFTDRSREDAGFAPRSFDSFMQAAEEAAISRLYGGIHYRFDSEAGLQQGKCVGERVNRLALRRK